MRASGVVLPILLLLGCTGYGVSHGNNPMENEDLFEGDITGIDPLLDRNAVVDEAELWPGGVVYYEIDRKFRNNNDFIFEAIDEYHNKTCLKFKKRTSATPDYLDITISTGCWSAVGRKGGPQEVSLAYGCHDKVSAVHEFGHAIGLWHEHSRSDRDEYLEILWDNIKPGSEHNFLKLKPWENNLLGEKFDYKSIMLYGEYAFSKDRKSMTMRPREPGAVIGLINNKPGLSESDVRRINKLYECFGQVRPPPPEVPDFKCDFETDMCGMEQSNVNANWTRTQGTLGGRTGSYITINAADASFRKVRIITPFFGAFGRKKACFSFDVYFNGKGALSLNIMVHDINTSVLVMKHVERKDEWQHLDLDIALKGDVKVSLDAHTRKSAGDGVVAVDNVVYKLRACNEKF